MSGGGYPLMAGDSLATAPGPLVAGSLTVPAAPSQSPHAPPPHLGTQRRDPPLTLCLLVLRGPTAGSVLLIADLARHPAVHQLGHVVPEISAPVAILDLQIEDVCVAQR